MKHILLVDDDDVFRPALQKNLENLGYKVTIAEDGQVAQQELGHQTFDLVISDIRMPRVDGIQLMKFLKQKFSTPIILMTGFAEILETKQGYELGANEFIAKPFDRSDLVKAIDRCLAPAAMAVPQDMLFEEDVLDPYCRLAVDDFTSGHQIKFNIFLRLSDTKFIKIAHKGEDLSIDRIREYRVKGLDFFYLKRDDFRKYVGFNVTLSKVASKSHGIDRIRRLNLLRHTGEVIVEQIQHDGVDKELYDDSATFIRSTVDMLTEDTDVFELQDLFNKHADHLYSHSVAVSLYSVMLAKTMGWRLPNNNFKVAIGGLLHDIGKKELDRSFLMKPRMHWTVDEVKAYESHSTRGADILRQINSIPEDIIQITQEHHEDCLAQGFPARLKKTQIHPMAKLISVASEFCNLVVKTPWAPPMRPREALAEMTRICAYRLDPQFFAALKKIFNFEQEGSSERPLS